MKMTKVASSKALEKAKEEMVKSVREALDMNEIKHILEDQHNLEISDDLQASGGEMIIRNNQLAYKMEFEVLLSFSVLLDTDGNYVPLEDSSPEEAIENLGSQAKDIIEGM